MLYVELAEFEIKHLHDLLEVVIARLDNFLRLLQPYFNNMVLVSIEIEGRDEELAAVHGHFYDALDVMTTYHAQISPEHFTLFVE